MSDRELERFKTEIDLREYAGALGFELDARASWRGSAVMVRGQQDKIIITRLTDGHYVYFSVKEAHGGTVIDLAKRYVSSNFGEVRKALRRWTGGEIPSSRAVLPPLEKTSKDMAGVARAWFAAREYDESAWLESARGIPPALLRSERFAGRFRIDGRGNVLFPHEDEAGRLCGFERKNLGFTGFAAGGVKGLGCSADLPGDRVIVFAESFIDMLSYAALFPDERARYRSFAGGLGAAQPGVIAAHIAAMPEDGLVIAATDADEAGARFAEVIEGLCQGRSFRAHRPESGDWNDVLRASFLPTALSRAQP